MSKLDTFMVNKLIYFHYIINDSKRSVYLCFVDYTEVSGGLTNKIVTRWIKAQHFAHVFFRCLSNILEGGARATTPWSG